MYKLLQSLEIHFCTHVLLEHTPDCVKCARHLKISHHRHVCKNS